MSNNMIFTVKPFENVTSTQNSVIQAVFFEESKKLCVFYSDGLAKLWGENGGRFVKETVLKPDIFNEEMKILHFTFIHSPFNFFRQNGRFSLVCLYDDGRLRFWDLESGKCYLVSKFKDFKDPKSILFMGTIFSFRKRFLYFVSALTSLSLPSDHLRRLDHEQVGAQAALELPNHKRVPGPELAVPAGHRPKIDRDKL